VRSPLKIEGADAIVLPGVGNFKTASRNVNALRNAVLQSVKEGKPLLGICLGMQLLFHESEESPGEGLKLLKGKVLKLPESVKIPHMGWNTINIIRGDPLLHDVKKDSHFYFVHSYYAQPESDDVILAETDYGVKFASVVSKGNVYGTQFHPEKSGKPGRIILRNFAKIVKR